PIIRIYSLISAHQPNPCHQRSNPPLYGIRHGLSAIVHLLLFTIPQPFTGKDFSVAWLLLSFPCSIIKLLNALTANHHDKKLF
ncbi:MAG: hypothetical protein ABJB86_25360, partial [Bacteroidota bacterium]